MFLKEEKEHTAYALPLHQDLHKRVTLLSLNPLSVFSLLLQAQ